MVCKNTVAFEPPAHRPRIDRDDRFALRRAGRHAPTRVARSRVGLRGATLLACEERLVIVVLGEQDALRQLDAGRLPCPSCGGRLHLWGHARADKSAGLVGSDAGCGQGRPVASTAALRTYCCPPLACPAARTGGVGWRANRHGAGAGCEAPSGARSGCAARGVAARAGHGAGLPGRPQPGGHPAAPLGAADAVEALGQAAAALTRRLGVLAAAPWQVIAAFTGGGCLPRCPAADQQRLPGCPCPAATR
jgi:hypothetical protein